ncbi:immunoglobulin-like domain-containing protein, partial [Polaribacter glomeratus]
MNKKITLVFVSFLFAISTTFGNNDNFFFENDIFTVVKNDFKSNQKTVSDFAAVTTTSPIISGFSSLEQYNNSSYYISDIAYTWDDAIIATNAVGGHLAVITTTAENDHIFAQMQAQGNQDNLLIGAFESSEGIFEWVNGEPYTNNIGGAVDNIPAGLNSFIVRNDNGGWMDYFGPGSSVTIKIIMEVPIPDTIKPVITLSGANPQIIEVGTNYTELGATATDNVDAANTLLVVSTVNNQDTGVVGSFTVDYTVSDVATNAAIIVTRTVNVVDVTKPVITLAGSNPQTIEVFSVYDDLTGAIATDNYDDNVALTANIQVISNVNSSLVGTYTATYNVVDSESNVADEITKTVHVVDTTLPEIFLVGLNPQIVEIGKGYNELGATATDNYDPDSALISNITNTSNVNTATAGSYLVSYNVTDANSNTAITVERIVIVKSN